jgi:endonuclease/exonuclease/phosphatase family metal-dependent hydrolase
MESPQQIALRLLTHNIRYATSYPLEGEEPWSTRCPRLCAELRFHSMSPATIICLQEVLHSQLLDIHTALNDSSGTKWTYVGVGRDDGKQSGEYSPIFYRPSVWTLENWSTVWLSDTPEKPSKGWDAGCVRIVTIGSFRHNETQRKVVIMNTHLDHEGIISRAESAKMILKLINEHQALSHIGDPLTLLLAGDFNSPPGDEAYKIMTSEGSGMVDVRKLIPKEKRYGNRTTFTSFGEPGSTPSLIDFIFCYKNNSVLFDAFGVLENRFDDSIYLSDHRAVVVDLTLLGN